MSHSGMALDYLDFDYSEDEHGYGSFDAMASVPAARVAAVRAEMGQVLDWAHATSFGAPAPLEEGGEWDYTLESRQEWSTVESIRYDESARQFSSQLGAPGAVRHTLTLTIGGSAQFCAAFRQRFGLA